MHELLCCGSLHGTERERVSQLVRETKSTKRGRLPSVPGEQIDDQDEPGDNNIFEQSAIGILLISIIQTKFKVINICYFDHFIINKRSTLYI